ncbi:hypothetical protein SBRCBS47491_000242 [Sporothrix bragantina]|uniref:Interferon-related developmental regulator N-terminal domain-containing protein n=1 Tax=Sporothrix bragantina TaxID=671064 RepID=A0ABP0ANP5_9PEZI
MHDMRKKALTESLKTTSRKARRRPDSLNGSNNSSRQASRHASNANSRAGSRYPSEDEDSGLSSAASKLRLAGHSPAKATRKNRYVGEGSDDSDDANSDDSDSEEEDVDDEMEELSDTELANNAILWQSNFNNVIAILEDRKRANLDERTRALSKYGRLLRAIYSSEAIASALPSIMEQLIKSIRKGNSGPGGEKQLALEDLSLTVLSCASDFDAIDAYEQTFSLVKRLVQDPDVDESDKVVALQTMTILVVVGSGMESTISELLNFLLNIVESDGDSVEAPDNGPVVTAAIQMWTFVSSFLTPEEPQLGDDYLDDGEEADVEDDDEDDYSSSSQDSKPNRRGGGKRGKRAVPEPEEEDEEEEESPSSDFDPDSEDTGEGYFELQGQRALNAFMEQLESNDPGVQTSSAVAVALIFEASRKQKEITGRPLELRQDPATVADQLKDLGNVRSVKSVKRQDRREIKDLFRQVTISLEYGAGPDYSPHSHKPNRAAGQTPSGFKSSGFLEDEEDQNPQASEKDTTIDETAYRKRLVIGDKAMPITTWAMSVRVDTLRAILGNGMPVHLLLNAKVRNFVSAKRLRRIAASTIKEKTKSRRAKKVAKSGGKKGNKSK